METLLKLSFWLFILIYFRVEVTFSDTPAEERFDDEEDGDEEDEAEEGKSEEENESEEEEGEEEEE